MKNYAERLNMCKASVKKFFEGMQICPKCSELCIGINDGIDINVCEPCALANKESLCALQACIDSFNMHADSCADLKCIKFVAIFLEKCRALMAIKKGCSHYCSNDHEQCKNAYSLSLKACK